MPSAGSLSAVDVTWTRRAARIPPERLESCIRRLEPADRALLDLSLNRRLPDETLAPMLRTEPMRLAWRRARAIERVASRLGHTHPADFPEVRAALTRLPDRAWLPLELQAAPMPKAIRPPEPHEGELTVRKAGPPSTEDGRAVSLPRGGVTSRAQRAMPRKAMTTHVRRAAWATAGALIGAAALTLARR